MKLKLDENLSRYLKPSLSAYQHEVMTAADEGLLAQPDPAVAAAAKSEGRMLFTLDVEFGDLRKYPPGSHPGIILFRPKTFGPLAVNRFVEAFVRQTVIKNMMTLAYSFVLVFEIYLGLGLLFALFFVTKGAGKIDPTAKAGTIGFRLLIIPGTMAFWPLLAKRWLQGTAEPPEEKNAHRLSAREKKV